MAPSIDIAALPQRIIPSDTISNIATKQSTPHFFAPLSASEIKATATIIKEQWPSGTDVHFKCITLQEPPKADLVPLLDLEQDGQTFTSPSRKAFVNYYIRNTVRLSAARYLAIS